MGYHGNIEQELQDQRNNLLVFFLVLASAANFSINRMCLLIGGVEGRGVALINIIIIDNYFIVQNPIKFYGHFIIDISNALEYNYTKKNIKIQSINTHTHIYKN